MTTPGLWFLRSGHDDAAGQIHPDANGVIKLATDTTLKNRGAIHRPVDFTAHAPDRPDQVHGMNQSFHVVTVEIANELARVDLFDVGLMSRHHKNHVRTRLRKAPEKIHLGTSDRG